MRDSRPLLILLGIVVLAAIAVWLWTRPGTDEAQRDPDDGGPIRFHQTEIPVKSPDLEIAAAEARGATYPGYSSWLITMSCAEPEGCAGEFAVEVRYRGGGENRRVVLTSRCDVPEGGELRFEGLEDPSAAVDRIDRLTLEVRERGAPDDESDEVEL